MNSSDRGNFYFGISDKKIYICYFENGKTYYKENINFEIPDDLSNDLNFEIILKLLKKNIRKIEKKLGFFLNSGNISIQSKSFQSILFSVKDIYDDRELDKDVIIKLIRGAMQQFDNCEKNLTILHVIINKYIVDNKVYVFYPNCKKFKKIVLELEFVCLNKILIHKVKNLFNECKIDIKKIVSYDYAKKFLDNIKDDTLCFSAHKILNGANQSEVILSENTLKKHNLFDKIFNFFDS